MLLLFVVHYHKYNQHIFAFTYYLLSHRRIRFIFVIYLTQRDMIIHSTRTVEIYNRPPMSSINYPVDLNPFGDDEEEGEDITQDYPDYLSPFGNDKGDCTKSNTANSNNDDYDNSLNPFGEPEEVQDTKVIKDSNNTSKQSSLEEYPSGVNPFEDVVEDPVEGGAIESGAKKEEEEKIEQTTNNSNTTTPQNSPIAEDTTNIDSEINQKPKPVAEPQPEPLEPPPIPFPRTKSLLKKAQQQANRTKIV